MGRSQGRTGGRRALAERLSTLEDDLAETNRHLYRLENALEGVLRETDGVSLGGPCRCGESLLVVRRRTIYCPRCAYRRTI